MPSECQTVWIQIRSDVTPDLICVQTVCKSYQQSKLAGKELMTMKPVRVIRDKNLMVCTIQLNFNSYEYCSISICIVLYHKLCHAEYFLYYTLLQVLSPIACSFPVVSSYFRKCGKQCDPEQMALSVAS